jgi:hypothetical protein
MHNETLSVIAVRIGNEDPSPAGIHSCNTAPAPTSFAEMVSDDFPILQFQRCLVIVGDHLRRTFARFKLCAHFLNERRLPRQFESKGFVQVSPDEHVIPVLGPPSGSESRSKPFHKNPVPRIGS